MVSVDLGTAANYTILAQTSLTAKSTSQIIGDVAYDGPDSTPTGFSQILNGATLALTDYVTSDRIDGNMLLPTIRRRLRGRSRRLSPIGMLPTLKPSA